MLNIAGPVCLICQCREFRGNDYTVRASTSRILTDKVSLVYYIGPSLLGEVNFFINLLNSSLFMLVVDKVSSLLDVVLCVGYLTSSKSRHTWQKCIRLTRIVSPLVTRIGIRFLVNFVNMSLLRLMCSACVCAVLRHFLCICGCRFMSPLGIERSDPVEFGDRPPHYKMHLFCTALYENR